MYTLRLATPADFDAVLARTQAFNAGEGIAIDDAQLRPALQRRSRCCEAPRAALRLSP